MPKPQDLKIQYYEFMSGPEGCSADPWEGFSNFPDGSAYGTLTWTNPGDVVCRSWNPVVMKVI